MTLSGLDGDSVSHGSTPSTSEDSSIEDNNTGLFGEQLELSQEHRDTDTCETSDKDKSTSLRQDQPGDTKIPVKPKLYRFVSKKRPLFTWLADCTVPKEVRKMADCLCGPSVKTLQPRRQLCRTLWLVKYNARSKNGSERHVRLPRHFSSTLKSVMTFCKTTTECKSNWKQSGSDTPWIPT